HDQLEPVHRATERARASRNEWELFLVVGTLDVDHAVEAAREFLPMIVEVRQEIGGLPAALHHHAVALEAERSGAQPLRAALLVEQARALEIGEHAVGLARIVEIALVGVDVELDADRFERLADLAEDLRLGGLAKDAVAGLVDERRTVPRDEPRGELA